jgi:uncharacterized membrane protein
MSNDRHALDYAGTTTRPPPPIGLWWLSVALTALPLVAGLGSTLLFVVTQRDMWLTFGWLSLSGWLVFGTLGFITSIWYEHLAEQQPRSGRWTWLPVVLFGITLPIATVCFVVCLVVIRVGMSTGVW